jgi:hypothetical protein
MRIRLIIITCLLFFVSTIINAQESWWDKTKQKAKEYYDNSKRNYEQWKQENPDAYRQLNEKIEEITYEVSRDPNKIFEYKQQADKYVQTSVITGVKSIPVYDSRTGQTTTFDSYCRQFVTEVGGEAIYGSEIERDPVGTAMMIMMDEDYILEAKLIQSPNGEWVSMNEAAYGFIDPNMLGLLQGDYSVMKQAYLNGNTNEFTRAFNNFENNLAIVNEFNSEYSPTPSNTISAAYNISVTTPKQCWSVLISEQEASGGQYGWWSVWHDKKRSGNVNSTPTTFYNVSPGKYVLVVYDPASNNYDPNSGRISEQSDGVVIEDIYIDGSTIYNFNLEQSDFKDWNCLSCPWLYVHDGKDYVKFTEVLKDVVGEENCKTDYVVIPSSFIIDNKLKILIREEKEEITFIDGISLFVNDKEIVPNSAISEQITYSDDNYLILKRDESIDLIFDLDESIPTEGMIELRVRGYYEPEENFVQRYLEELK